MSTKNTPENFWKYVDRKDPISCWEWIRSRTSSGYGHLSWHGAHVQAHRVAYFLTFGGIELETNFRHKGKAKAYKRFVLHKCDNRACCNPNHLFLGSMRANLLDAYQKKRKRQPQSEHVNAKLTPEQVQEIRSRYDRGESKQVPLAKEFGVSQRVISLIVRRESYRDVL
jgi:hypothetical protein